MTKQDFSSVFSQTHGPGGPEDTGSLQCGRASLVAFRIAIVSGIPSDVVKEARTLPRLTSGKTML